MSESDLDSALKMRHWEAAFLILVHLDEEELWERAGQAAIKCLETSSAALFYRHIQQVANLLLRFFDDISFSRTYSQGTYS